MRNIHATSFHKLLPIHFSLYHSFIWMMRTSGNSQIREGLNFVLTALGTSFSLLVDYVQKADLSYERAFLICVLNMSLCPCIFCPV